MAVIPTVAIARKHARRIATGLSLLLGRPREVPRTLIFTVRYLWNVKLRRKNMLVLARLGGLGDLACLLACVPALRQRHRNSWLVVITPMGCQQLAASSGLADATAERDGFLYRFARWLCPRSTIYYPRLPDEYDPPRPQVLHLADEFARTLGVKADLSCVHFQTPRRVRWRLAHRLREINPRRHPVVVLHPGPTWPVREWPSHQWCELTKLILESTSAVMIKIGTDMTSMGQAMPSSPIPHAVDWTNQLDVMETTALLGMASVFVGIDSGPLHLAGILGVPAVGLFGPVSPRLRLPPQARAVIVTGRADCLGCHHRPTGQLHWQTGCPHDILCMREIGAKDVFAALAPHIGGEGCPAASESATLTWMKQGKPTDCGPKSSRNNTWPAA
jgi:ADP-heptose:LPS heptosyltransferase